MSNMYMYVHVQLKKIIFKPINVHACMNMNVPCMLKTSNTKLNTDTYMYM